MKLFQMITFQMRFMLIQIYGQDIFELKRVSMMELVMGGEETV